MNEGNGVRELTCRTLQETEALGRALAGHLRAGDVVLLEGDLGAGKTALARALIRARAGEDIDVPSPSFAIVQSYPFEPPFFHLDLYRLDDAAQAIELGIDDMLEGGVTLVEWPQKAPVFPQDALWIAMTIEEGGARRIRMTAGGARSGQLLSAAAGELEQ